MQLFWFPKQTAVFQSKMQSAAVLFETIVRNVYPDCEECKKALENMIYSMNTALDTRTF